MTIEKSKLEQKYHRVQLKMRDQNVPPTGGNCQVLIDGEPVKMATKVVIEAVARGIVKVSLEMLAYAEVDVIGELSTKIIPLKVEKSHDP